jgi:predicted ATPase
LFFEDEQWADITSRELLNELIADAQSIPALILVSKRTELETTRIESEAVLQLKLNPLDPEDAKALILDMSPTRPVSAEVVAFVLDRAEGLPLYIEELTPNALEIGLPLDPSQSKRRAADGDGQEATGGKQA